MESLQAASIALTLGAAVLLIAGIRDIRRRRPFPGAEHGHLRISGSRMKWVWGLTLLLAFIAGGPDLVSHTTSEGLSETVTDRRNAPAAAEESEVNAVTWNVAIAAYHGSGREERRSDGGYYRMERTAVRAPVLFLLALLAYWLVVVRPVPRRRFAAREKVSFPA